MVVGVALLFKINVGRELLEEGLNAANSIGDDTLQKQMQGYAVPKTFAHGTSEQRKFWFERGYSEANPASCDTF